jgi:hypothetical protein
LEMNRAGSALASFALSSPAPPRKKISGKA